jgi:hypothetical protein
VSPRLLPREQTSSSPVTTGSSSTWA